MNEPYKAEDGIYPRVIGPGVHLTFASHDRDYAHQIAACLNCAYMFGKYVEKELDEHTNQNLT